MGQESNISTPPEKKKRHSVAHLQEDQLSKKASKAIHLYADINWRSPEMNEHMFYIWKL